MYVLRQTESHVCDLRLYLTNLTKVGPSAYIRGEESLGGWVWDLAVLPVGQETGLCYETLDTRGTLQ